MLIKPDPATPEGEAVIALADLMDGLLADAGEWPGADTVGILEGWLSRFTFAVSEPLTAQAVGRTWVLRQQDRYGDDVTLWSDEASALAALARDVRTSWDDVAGMDDVPCRPPTDDQAAVDLYYGCFRDSKDYVLHAADISRVPRTDPDLSLSDAGMCAAANSAAVFHAQEGPDDEGLPCVEIAGILVFVYLDADKEALRVSVDLDTANEQVVRAHGTVPVQVDIGDSPVFSNPGTPPAAAETSGWRDRLRRFARRTALRGGGRLRQGG
ncbi:hypothetical protein [Streptomyces sp. NPDC096013]|uniref:hypothetical protein n=1 Tax=Streptomyces sp. NPDC096013 TaxID=3366069 RepID=UPI003827E322